MTPSILLVDDNQALVEVLTHVFEDAGYTVIGVGKGKLALEAAKEHPISAAVLDLLLPDMTGTHLAEQLRALHPKLPLVFITGVFKGSKHSLDAKNRFGVLGFFEKQFDARKLLECIKAAVPPPVKAKSAAPPPPPADFDVDLNIDVEEEHPQETMELTGKIRVTGDGNITAELSGANIVAKGAAPGPAPGMKPPPPPRSELAAGPPPRTGDFKDNLPRLINAFFLSKETGELSVQRGKVKKVIYFESGSPVFALSNLAADRFGQFLVRVGKIKAEQLQDVAVVAAQSKRRTGDVLVERGLLKDTERLYYVGQQVKAIIYSLFGWEDGTYSFSFTGRARAEAIKLDLHPGNFIVRGIKKLYKPERLLRLAPDEEKLAPSQNPVYQLQEVDLEKWEAELLTKANGVRTNAELVTLSGKPDHVVRAFLVGMHALGILEPML